MSPEFSNSPAAEPSPDLPASFDPSRPLRDPGREAFCQELTAGEQLYDAYESAGFKRPRGNAQRMLHEEEVAQRIAYLHARVAELDEVLLAYRRMEHRRALENIASADRLGLFEEKFTGKGKRKRRTTITLRPFAQLTAEQRALIDGLEVTDKGALKVVMPKRLDARAMLAKLDGLDKPSKVSPTNPEGDGPALQRLEVTWKDSVEPAKEPA